MTAEADMWAAAIEYAFRAACRPVVETGRKDTGGGCEPSEAADEWRFLTDTAGGWAESRAIICWINGVDPDVVRNEAIRRGISRQAKYGLLAGEARQSHLLEINARDATILREYAAGRPMGDIASEYGLTVNRIQQIAGEHGVKRPKNNTWPGRVMPSADPARNAAIIADWEAGVSLPDIAEKHGVRVASAKSIARRAGAKRPETFRLAILHANGAAAAARNAERNAEIARRHADGETIREISKAMKLSPKTIRRAVETGSAVESRGASRAAGGCAIESMEAQCARTSTEGCHSFASGSPGGFSTPRDGARTNQGG